MVLEQVPDPGHISIRVDAHEYSPPTNDFLVMSGGGLRHIDIHVLHRSIKG